MYHGIWIMDIRNTKGKRNDAENQFFSLAPKRKEKYKVKRNIMEAKQSEKKFSVEKVLAPNAGRRSGAPNMYWPHIWWLKPILYMHCLGDITDFWASTVLQYHYDTLSQKPFKLSKYIYF
jgi:hypothetical protein